jgi:tRNA(Ile)-lysidine synthase
VVARVRAAVAAALDPEVGLVLAVSGGRDSMVLLDAALAVAPERVRLVATYDHGTGPVARRAVRHVRAAARAAGVPVRAGRGPAANSDADATEAAWRTARWAFLRRAARHAGRGGGRVVIATGAHGRRPRRDARDPGAARRGGARPDRDAVGADGVVRPLLGVASADVATYAAARGIGAIDDPSNASPRHLRNRVRHDVLPVLARVRPTFVDDLRALGAEAAAWRREVDRAAAQLAARCPVAPPDGGRRAPVLVAVADLAEYDEGSLRVLWPAILARAGVRADRRGTVRLAAFTTRCVERMAGGRSPAASAELAGGVRVTAQRRRDTASAEWAMVVDQDPTQTSARDDFALTALTVGAGWTTVGRWRFRLGRVLRPADDGGPPTAVSAGHAWLPAHQGYAVRPWRPGDRWRVAPDRPARRVKRFLSDHHVPAADRAGWPVVVTCPPADAPGGAIVWIPGVRRADAAPARPGEPGLLLRCERTREPRPRVRP